MTTAVVPVEIWSMILRCTIPFKASSKQTLVSFAQCSRFSRDVAYPILYEVVNLFTITQDSYTRWSRTCTIQSLDNLLDNITLLPLIKELTIATEETDPFPALNRLVGLFGAFTALKSLSLINVSITPAKFNEVLVALAGQAQRLGRLSFERMMWQNAQGEVEGQDTQIEIPRNGLNEKPLAVHKIRWNLDIAFGPNQKFFDSEKLESLSLRHQGSDMWPTAVLSTLIFPCLHTFKLVLDGFGRARLLSTFLENHYTIERLKLDAGFDEDFSISSTSLPRLQMVRGSFKTLQQLIPGRPVSQVEWNGDFEEVYEGFDTLPELLTKSTAISMKHLTFPELIWSEKLLVDLFIQTLKTQSALESLGFVLHFDSFWGIVDILPSLRNLRLLKLNLAWGYRLPKPDPTARKEVLDYFRSLPDCAIEHIIWSGLRKMEFSKVGSRDWVIVDDSLPDLYLEDDSEEYDEL